MKKIVLFFIGALFVSCSKDDSSNEQIIDDKDVIITSYSKDYGMSGDIIKIDGENFPNKENCKIYFDDVLAEIISVDSDGNEIQVKLPEIDSGIPKLKFDFGQKKYINNVNNEFNSNIGVINKKIGQWAVTKTPLPINYDNYIKSTQITNNKNIYLASSTGYAVYSSKNNGLTWGTWNNTGIGFYGDFHVTESGNGWVSSQTSLIERVITHSSDKYFIFKTNPPKEFIAVYIEEDLQTGLVVTFNGDVYKTYNGGETMGGVPMNISRSLFRPSFKIDINNIWTIGSKNASDSSSVQYGVIYYCNGDNNVWNEYVFNGIYNQSVVDNIYFIDDKIGYCILRRYYEQKNHLFKTSNGGVSWEHVSEMEYNAKGSWVVFVNQNEGYLVRDNSILKTIDGGLTWNVDFTAENPIQNLNIKDNCLYVFTKGMIVRKFLQ